MVKAGLLTMNRHGWDLCSCTIWELLSLHLFDGNAGIHSQQEGEKQGKDKLSLCFVSKHSSQMRSAGPTCSHARLSGHPAVAAVA